MPFMSTPGVTNEIRFLFGLFQITLMQDHQSLTGGDNECYKETRGSLANNSAILGKNAPSVISIWHITQLNIYTFDETGCFQKAVGSVQTVSGNPPGLLHDSWMENSFTASLAMRGICDLNSNSKVSPTKTWWFVFIFQEYPIRTLYISIIFDIYIYLAQPNP